ncbi:helix-turn-helix domain-containing protein [Cutibacterium avidum]|uniref:helix-turn-helix domain-containing protein n=1 Tax=Cutibacterium avidum TaxID=33010 RepID=UPI002FF13265
MNTTEVLLTPRQAAEQLGKSARTVRKMCSTREITHIETTGPKGQARYRISQSAIAAFLREHTVTRRLS